MKFAIVGRRNVGKSTFINTLVESERMIVSEVAGTTRDSVDVRFELDGKTLVAIDTPGLRKGKSVRTDIEFYGTHRAHRTIRHADVVLMMFDCSQRISKVDRQLCSYIEENYKPCIFVVNKWDLMAEHMPTERWADYIRDNFSTMWNAPIAFRHRANRTELQTLVESRADAVQTVAAAGVDASIESVDQECLGQASATDGFQQKTAEELLRGTNWNRAADDHAQVQQVNDRWPDRFGAEGPFY